MTERNRILYSISLSALLWALLITLALLVPLHMPPPVEAKYNDVTIRFDLSRTESTASSGPVASTADAASAEPETAPGAALEEQSSQTSENQARSSESIQSPEPVSQDSRLAALAPTPQPSPVPRADIPQRDTPRTPARETVPAPVFAPTPQTSVPQQTPTPELAPVPQQLAPDLSSGVFPTAQADSTRTETARPAPQWPDEEDFAEFSSSSASNTAAVTTNTAAVPETVFSGTAGSAVAVQDRGAAVSGTGQRSDTSADSESLSSSLGRITGTAANRGSSGGVSAEGALTAGSSGSGSGSGSDGSFAAVGGDGQKRRLRQPSEPVITLSPESEALIGSSIQVTITITVLPSGIVQRSGIEFSPASALNPQVRDEIRNQISQWRFDPGETNGQATFEYSIKKE